MVSTRNARPVWPAAAFLALSAMLPEPAHGQDLSAVPPEEWASSFERLGEDTPYPPWDLFIGGCPADEAWRGVALRAMLEADLDQRQRFVLASMIGGMNKDSFP